MITAATINILIRTVGQAFVVKVAGDAVSKYFNHTPAVNPIPTVNQSSLVSVESFDELYKGL